VTSSELLTVIQPAAPAVSLSVAPPAPIAGQLTTLTATATPAANHNIVRYEWSFGDGESATTTSSSVSHTYARNGTYTVTVTAYDDLGQGGTAATAVVIGSGVTATITFSPTNPKTGDVVRFNGGSSAATSGATIVEYQWDFGNGDTRTSSSPVANTTYATANTYTVRLTVVDSLGRTATDTEEVTVEAP
jgi:PKD repeat protein